MKINIDEALFVTEGVRYLTESTYVLRFSRNGICFTPGQHLVLGLPGSEELREYSIYSGTGDEFLEVLIREVDTGMVSRQLKTIREGDSLEVRGPYGFFLSREAGRFSGKKLFISSGTGIAPFHSYVTSRPGSDYRLIHGVRHHEEAYDSTDYERSRITVCTSRDALGDFHGRLTDYLTETELDPEYRVYLCGNSKMIHDAMNILRIRGFSEQQMFTEIYF